MRSLKHLRKYERRHPVFGNLASNEGLDKCGFFLIPFKNHHTMFRLAVLASDGGGWDHVSVSLFKRPDKTPSWEVMCFIKDLFFEEHETVVQFHPPKSEYINNANALHLWRDQGNSHNLPPSIMVGIKNLNQIEG